jgi:mannitol/fructose-specific phosphotransferase system IIA component (Ntr-type)
MDKERLLRGAANIAVCPSCGYQSQIAMPIVYHDPEKELLLTYFPAELNMSLLEQQKIIGPMITKVVNSLPPEKKKGYLFQPRTMLTYDTLFETILEADGITKEMINEQKYKGELIRRLLQTSPESLVEVIHQEESHIDQSFFLMLNNTLDAAVQMRDKDSFETLKNLQEVLFRETEYGRELKKRADSTQKAISDLQAVGENLNRDTLLDLVLAAPDDSYLQTLAGLARNGMDYEFFTKLSGRIDAAEGEDKEKYLKIRSQLLELTQQIDKALAEEKEMRRKLLEEIVAQDDMESAVYQVVRAIDQTFTELVREELAAARKAGDFMRSGKLQQLLDIIQKLYTAPEEIQRLEKLLGAETEDSLKALIDEEPELNTPEMKNLVTELIEEGKAQNSLTPEVMEKLQMIQKVLG